MDNLFEQFANISKAHAYDYLAECLKKLKDVTRELIQYAELEDLEFIDPIETEKFQELIKKAKILCL